MLMDAIREELVEGLKRIFQNNISMIILYGSMARNEAANDSDIDIAIVIKHEMDNQTKKSFISWAADMDMRYEKVFSIVDI